VPGFAGRVAGQLRLRTEIEDEPPASSQLPASV